MYFVLHVTSCFHVMGQIQIQAIGDSFTVTCQEAPGEKCAIFDCLVNNASSHVAIVPFTAVGWAT